MGNVGYMNANFPNSGVEFSDGKGIVKSLALRADR
jgi:hypothetical protein